MRERMLRGELYIADDPDSQAEFDHVQELLAEFNGAPARAWAERDRLLRQVLRHVGSDVVVRAPFYCEYGAISIGDGTFINVDAVMLDVAPITIGAACQIATRVQLLTATHPIDPEPRRAGWEYGEPIALAAVVILAGCGLIAALRSGAIGLVVVLGAALLLSGLFTWTSTRRRR